MRTKFTERIFSREFLSHIEIEDLRDDAEENFQPTEDYSFKEFIIIVWHFCTLNNGGIARYIFEIFDPGNLGTLEKADVEAMYRFLFDTAEHDERCINAIYPFDENEKISKEDFILYSSAKTKKQNINDASRSAKIFTLGRYVFKNTDLIEPAIQVQELLRSKLGSVSIWNTLTNYRTRYYSTLEAECSTLTEAVGEILRREVEKMEKLERSAELELQEARRRVLEENEAVQREIKERELQEEREMRKIRATARDAPMSAALAVFEDRKQAFIHTEFTLDDVWERREARLELFALLDEYVKQAREYWEWKFQHETEVIEGSPEDFEYRYQDYIKTPDGKAVHDLMVLYNVYQRMQNVITAKNSKRKDDSMNNKSTHEMFVEKYLLELQKLQDSVLAHDVDPQEMTRRLFRLKEKDLQVEEDYAKKKAPKNDWIQAQSDAHIKLSDILKEKTLHEFKKDLEIRKEEKRREFIRRDFELSSTFGSRITKWELVYDKARDVMVYVSVDTLEQRHAKTAICERCDEIIVQHEMRCTSCGAMRSARNQKLFRPLGYKDITLD